MGFPIEGPYVHGIPITSIVASIDLIRERGKLLQTNAFAAGTKISYSPKQRGLGRKATARWELKMN
jgi:hypothetical protein